MDPQILEVGELVTLKGRFANAAGVATDPTNVTLTVTDPAGTVTTIGPLVTPYAPFGHPSTGLFTSDLTVNLRGTWKYRWTGGGAIVAGETGYLIVYAAGSAGSPRSGPCSNWISVDQLTDCGGVPEAATLGQKEQAIAVASDLLWRWSGYKYGGLCFDSVRPCAQNSYLEQTYSWDRYDGWGGWGWNSGLWGTCACQASSHRACGCSTISEIQLGRIPIAGIVEVRIDGAVVSPTKYRIDDYQWLVRTDSNVWPCCQNLALSDAVGAGGINTFAVDFIWGQNPPPAGVEAATDLAVQTVKACVGADCELPEEFAQIVRQGETRINIQPTDLGRDQNGNIREGLRSVDRFLSSVSTHRPLVVASPDIDAKVRRVAT